MKIEINNVRKFAAMGLVLVSATTLAGCKTTLNEVITYEKPKSSITQVVDKKSLNLDEETLVSKDETKATKDKEEKPIKKSLEEIALAVLRGDYGNNPERKEKLELEGYDYIEVQKLVTKMVEEIEASKSLFQKYDENPVIVEDLNAEINTYYASHMDEINDVLNPEYHDIHVKYGSLIYQRLVNAGISKDVLLGELANVILEQQAPRCVSEEEWQNNFGNIVSVLGEYESMYEAYFCLSYLVHDEICELEHSHNDVGAITCDELQKDFQKKYSMQ